MKQKEKDAAPFSGPGLLHIQLGEIMADPNQPRKQFDEIVDAEFLSSIKTQGILQPILVRPVKSVTSELRFPSEIKYLIVCGERRYRAAAAAGFLMIPAIVRELNDEDTLEAQIVENLQRKDVHEMEEAIAFKALAGRGLTQEEIGIRVGKNERFIRSRLILCQLTQLWQGFFLRRSIDLTTALKICRYPPDVQDDIFKELHLSKTEADKKDLRINVTNLASYKGDLSTACFDLTDKMLNPIMGSCIGCQFNSATADLFEGDTKRPRCLNPLCFKEKVDAGFKQKMAAALDNEDIVLVKSGFRREEDDKTVKNIKAKGLKVIDDSNYHDKSPEDPGTFEEWKAMSLADEWGSEDYDPRETDEENKAVYDRQLKQFDREKSDVEKGLKSGKYKRALVVQGDDKSPKGKIMVVELITRSSGNSGSGKPEKTPAQKIAENKGTIADYTAEIARVTESIKTTAKHEVDEAHLNMISAFRAIPGSKSNNTRAMTAVERNLLIIYMIEELGGFHSMLYWSDKPEELSDKEIFASSVGFSKQDGKKPKEHTLWNMAKGWSFDKEEDRGRIWDFVSGLTDGHLALIFRRLILDKFGGVTTIPSSYKSGQAFIMRKIIEQWDGHGPKEVNIFNIEEEAKIKAKKRIDNAKAKIKQLEADKEILEIKKKGAKKEETPAITPPKDKAAKKKDKAVVGESKEPEIITPGKKPVLSQLPAGTSVLLGLMPMDKAGTPAGDIKWPGAGIAIFNASLDSYEKYGIIADLINGFPPSPYSDYYLTGLAGNWSVEGSNKKMSHESAARIIVRSAEFIALLRITQKGLTNAELKYLDFKFPELAAATDPGKCREIVDKLVTFWKKQEAQTNRKGVKEDRQEAKKAVVGDSE